MFITEESKRLLENFNIVYNNKSKKAGVIYPSETELPAIVFLYSIMPNKTSHDEITEFYKRHTDQSYNKQIRHAAPNKKWYLVSGNTRATLMEIDETMNRDEIKLVSMELPNPVDSSEKRTGTISDDSWENIKEKYKERGCGMCGRKMDHYDKGHLDPNKGYSIENIVPLCSSCNNYISNRPINVYDGLVVRLTNP